MCENKDSREEEITLNNWNIQEGVNMIPWIRNNMIPWIRNLQTILFMYKQ